MDVKRALNERLSAVVIVFTVAIVLLPIIYSVIGYVFARSVGKEPPFLEMPDAKYTECVRDTEYMRFHHWELLVAMRDESVRYGKRNVVTFDDCRVCHQNRAGFCNQCHNAVNLDPDCWGCHYYPETPEESLDDARLDVRRLRAGVSPGSLGEWGEGEEDDG
jgi:hypothetical protein